MLPSKAYAKISTRLVPDQDYQEIGRLFEDYIRQLAPPEVKVQVRFKHGGNPYVCSLDCRPIKRLKLPIIRCLANVRWP